MPSRQRKHGGGKFKSERQRLAVLCGLRSRRLRRSGHITVRLVRAIGCVDPAQSSVLVWRRSAANAVAESAGADLVCPKHRAVPYVESCTSGKRRFASERIAEAELLRLQGFYEDVGSKRIPTRTYMCVHCGGWHVTSKEYR